MKDETPKPRPSLLAAFVHAVTAALFAEPIAVTPGGFSAFMGALAGAIVGPLFARTALRTPLVVALALVPVGVAELVVALVRAGAIVPARANVEVVLAATDFVFFGLAAFGVSAALRAATTRRRSLAVVEVLAVGLVAAHLVSGHRNGAINRPFELADPLLQAGFDPTWLFIGLGALAMALVALVLVRERSYLRTPYHLFTALLFLLLLVYFVRTEAMPTPPPPDAGLGLRPDEDGDVPGGRRGGRGGNRGGRGRQRLNEGPDYSDDASSNGPPSPIAVVIFRDEYSPPTGVYYFRQAAFSEWNGRKLVAALRQEVDEDVVDTFPSQSARVEDASSQGARRDMATSVALLAEHNQPFGLEAPVRFAPATNPDPTRFLRVYDVTSRAIDAELADLIGARAGDDAWSNEERALYTQVPDDPRYLALAREILASSGLAPGLEEDPAARVAAIVEWLGREGTYSLRSRHTSADDPAADFLFGDRIGYCVHFAHAATYLIRSLGIPARVATGYAVSESSRQGGSSLLLTDAMGHAWPEVRLEGHGWVVADVYPQRSLDPPPETPDRDLQRLLGEMARGESSTPPPTPEQAADNPVIVVTRAARDLWSMLKVGVPIALLVVVAFAYLVKAYRRLAPAFARSSALPRLAYRATLDRLAEAGIRRARGETREAFARRVSDVTPTLPALTELHVGAAFGSASAQANAGIARDHARAVRRELGGHRTLRRVLGLLDPFHFFWSR